jgi:hypothetical protein
MAELSEEQQETVDGLYALPLDEFTPARDELARRLRREGDGEAGAEVKRLRKPSVAAWALNQVRRKQAKESDDLLEAGRRLREAQESLLAGEGRESLQRAAAEERRLVGELAHLAERELAAAGRSVSAAVQEKLRATLHAVASDPEARDGLAAGRLVRDHEASGLGPLADAPAAPSTGPAAKGRAKAPASGPGAKTRARQPSAAERKVQRLEERLERAQVRLQELDEESAAAELRLREARREATRVAAQLERAEAAEERSRKRAEEAAAAVADVERELRAAREAS